LLQIEQGKEFSSLSFFLSDKSNKKYTQPGAWGKIKVMGTLSNFEATEGATVYVRNPDEMLNLMFEVPIEILPNQVFLKFDESNAKTSESDSTKSSK